MRAIALVLALACAGCGSDRTETPQAPPPHVDPPRVDPPRVDPPPPPIPGPTGRSIVRTERPFVATGTTPDADEIVEQAMQRAATCYSRSASRDGVIELAIAIGPDGRVSGTTPARDELSDPSLVACLAQEIGRLGGRPPTTPGPVTLSVAWRFETIDRLDHELDCATDRDCRLASGVCGGPVSVRDGISHVVDARNRAQREVARCAEVPIVPVLARCREGYCAAVPADLPELRTCSAASDCAVIRRRCGWDTFSASRRADAEAAVAPEAVGRACDPVGSAPPAQCASGFCTLDWGAGAAP